MFGPRMWVPLGESWLMLRPFEKVEMSIVAKGWQRMDIHMYTYLVGGATLEDEEEWYERVRKEENSYIWAIVPLDASRPIGVTGIHNVNQIGGCHTGIIIWDKDWWGKRVASSTHFARTLFAADYLGRVIISSSVREPNVASRKALERIGYVVTGKGLRDAYRQGQYFDTLYLSWLNPDRIDILYPEGIPNTVKIKAGLEKAQKALDKAREVVQFDPPETN